MHGEPQRRSVYLLARNSLNARCDALSQESGQRFGTLAVVAAGQAQAWAIAGANGVAVCDVVHGNCPAFLAQ